MTACVRKSIDEESYSIHFTPRKPASIWSAVNIKKMEALTKAGLMTEAGQKAFELRKEEKSAIYSHEKDLATLDPELEKQFKSHPEAREFFNSQAPSYKKVMLHWIMSAKQEKQGFQEWREPFRSVDWKKNDVVVI